MYEGGTIEADEATASRRDPDTPVTLAEVLDSALHLGLLLEALQPDDVLFSECVDMWEAFSLLSRLGSAGATLLARRVDQSRRWARAGHRNVDDYLAQLGGESPTDARRQRQASERLRTLPDTEEQLRKGRLSPGQRDAVTDGAATNPQAERDLLDAARKKSLRDLREDVGRAKTAADPDPDATHQRNHRDRKARIWIDSDQTFHLHANASTLDGQPLKTAIDRITDDLFRHRRRAGTERESRDAYAFDALQLLAHNYLNDHRDAFGDGDRQQPDADPGDPGRHDRKRHGRLKYQAILRLDLESLIRGRAEGDELCEITGLGPIPVTQARALLTDSVLHLVLTNGVDVQNVTYLGRGPNAAQNIALLWSDPHCTNIACPNTLHLESDHRNEYSKVRCTELHNIDRPCDHCHDLKTYEGWAFVHGTGRRPLVRPDHPLHPDNTNSGREPPDPPDTPDPEPELFPDTG